MSIFVVVPTADSAGIKKALERHKELKEIDYIDLPKDGFLVSYSGTSQELSGLIGISDGSSGTGIVAAISSYFGRAPTNIWDWVQSRWGA